MGKLFWRNWKLPDPVVFLPARARNTLDTTLILYIGSVLRTLRFYLLGRYEKMSRIRRVQLGRDFFLSEDLEFLINLG